MAKMLPWPPERCFCSSERASSMRSVTTRSRASRSAGSSPRITQNPWSTSRLRSAAAAACPSTRLSVAVPTLVFSRAPPDERRPATLSVCTTVSQRPRGCKPAALHSFAPFAQRRGGALPVGPASAMLLVAGTAVALTETDLQEVVAHVKSMLPSMMMEVVPGFAESRAFADRVIARIEKNLVRVESHLARSEERWEQEFKAQRELMQAGFAAMDKRFEDVNERFEDVNKRFEDVDKRFEDVNKRFEDVNKRFEDVDKRFEDVNKRFEDLNANLDKRFAAVDRRFEDMNQRFEDMNKRFSALQWMGTVAFVVLGIVVTVVGLS